ncbi:YnfC family lipoprotein [Erwinia sp. CPCC 100877]|nr:YnfC family lipoprotein [Erwinia sp. CPCC 100877]
MKKSLLCLAIILTAWNVRGESQVPPFHPAMASLSNELEFDALRGNVKSFEQTLYGVSDKPLMVAKGLFDPSGCLKEYERADRTSGESMKLVRDTHGNTLVSVRDKRNTIVLNDKCQIVETTNRDPARKRYIYEKGFLVKVKDAKDAWVYREYFYTREGMPKSMVLYGEQNDVLLITEPKRKLEEPWDFITQGLSNGTPFYQAMKKCRYDKMANPLVCDYAVNTLTNGGEKKERQQIRYRTTYY